ncbi:carboxylesterase/lipase family protein [Novosphingobium cyanobacteriorum]|uniref:Carboxylic ester hydrolase n=1 Tax=Novosphingobium cyanobacteriorum TaxID=3024215 RepID=A0ABT6CIP8_9SPHN|nr:carboxylesterase family protein [Novosphingobium cyanobacteriorum]MDF8333787.1 carboxylesterase family protein [Novosphingobium cyanobacteriorum]
MIRKAIGVAAFCLAASLQPALAQSVVKTTAGAIQGAASGGVEAFLGIPYAAPPVGDDRWREPRPARPWEGVRDGSAMGPSCQQAEAGGWGPYSAEFIAAPPFSEDCLTLNVWKPAGKVRGRLPVLVFIHGGGFGGGGSAVPLYNGGRLAARGVVVVTINYRVGVFGFLAHPQLTAESPLRSSGNYGLLDQIAALGWVRANAAAFGGDPANITVSGESAGAASVNDLMVSPLAKGLFDKAIAFSGPSMAVDVPSIEEGYAVAKTIAAKVGAASLADLRAVPPQKLVDATRYVPGESSGPARLVHVPHRDGVVLPFDPFRAGGPVVNAVPLLGGYNAAEMIDPTVRTPAQFEAAVKARYGDFGPRLLALYPHANDAEAVASNTLLARDRYMAGLLLWSQDRTRSVKQPIYAYVHDHAYPALRGGQSWGAFHSSGLPYVFGTVGIGDRTFTAADHALAKQWQDRLLAFLRTGKPSLPGRAWPPVKAGDARVMRIGDRAGMVSSVSTPARLQALRDYAASGGKLGLL